ncbi:ADP-ribosylation factor-like protein 16 [Pseudolycoriella hygida]|uniref:ADP-ribosylation factor-like protein 16 n=1 Tax=Pseudolycoriella hygida TaxID=35572 RepID=A0A9Q0RU01_9DIPT|nr:ADP-ribosylation factor-like protein 16 [Pseudolycoriella hygida]
MTVLCLGPKYAGKTHLLTKLTRSQLGENVTSPHIVPTIGTNIFSIKLPARQKTTSKQKSNVYVQVREVGGTMAPMWKNYFGDVKKLMYVVDTSNLCQISAAGVLLYSLLADPRLQHAKVIIVLTKMDLAYRQMRNEALLMLQLDKLKKQIRQEVTVVETSAILDTGKDKILDWLAQ